MTPPFPQLVSRAASFCRSTTSTVCPALLRCQAVAIPTAPAPRTIVVMDPSFGDAPDPSSAFSSLGAVAARARPHFVHLAIDAGGDVARHVAQDLFG